MCSRYSLVRQFLPALLATIDFEASPAGQPVLDAAVALRSLEGRKKVKVDEVPTDWVRPAWGRLLASEDGQLNRRAYTFAVLERLRAGLRTRDVFVTTSERWCDPRTKLLATPAWEAARTQVCRTLGLSSEPSIALGVLGAQLEEAYRRTAGRLATNAAVEFASGKVKLSALDRLDEPESLCSLRDRVGALLPRIDLPDLLPAGRHAGAANGRLVDYHATLALARAWGGGEVASADGLRFVVPVRSVHAGPVFGLFRLLGYQFSPRLADIGEARFWRLDRHASYDALDQVARHRIDGELITAHWDDLLRVAGSLLGGSVRASELLRVLHSGGRPSGLGRALAEVGRVAKTIFLLAYLDDEAYRRRILTQLNRGEARHALARKVFHGHGGELRQPYREGQEDQLGALGLVLNAIAVWNTRYMAAALDHLRATDGDVAEEDVERLSPLRHDHINLHGRCYFTVDFDRRRAPGQPTRDLKACPNPAPEAPGRGSAGMRTDPMSRFGGTRQGQ